MWEHLHASLSIESTDMIRQTFRTINAREEQI